MGCAPSTVAPAAVAGRPPQPVPQAEKALPSAPAPAARRRSSLLAEGPLPVFEMSTPMLVMPFSTFKAQGRIFKSTRQWRDKALADGSLLRFAWVEGGTGKVVGGALDGRIVVMEGKLAVFLSHTWWDRAFADETNDPTNPYDKGAPDWREND